MTAFAFVVDEGPDVAVDNVVDISEKGTAETHDHPVQDSFQFTDVVREPREVTVTFPVNVGVGENILETTRVRQITPAAELLDSWENGYMGWLYAPTFNFEKAVILNVSAVPQGENYAEFEVTFKEVQVAEVERTIVTTVDSEGNEEAKEVSISTEPEDTEDEESFTERVGWDVFFGELDERAKSVAGMIDSFPIAP